MSNDLHNNCDAQYVFGPVAIGANATKTGKIIDRQGYGGIEFICGYGAVTTTGTIATVVVKDGDVTGTLTSVADDFLLGTEALASLLATTPRTSGVAQNVVKRIGYVGSKRYVQLNVVTTGVTSVGAVSIGAVLHNPAIAPVDNP